MFSRGRVAAGLFLERKSILAEKYILKIADRRVPLQFRNYEDSTLRPYQKKAVEAMIESSRTGSIILAATGSGKTRLAADFYKRLIGKGLFIVDELVLLVQSQIEISKALNEKVGVVGNSEFKPERITIATIQTLSKHRTKLAFKKWFDSINAIIIDEVHLALNKRNLDVVQQIRPQAVYGLTATLQIHKPHVWMPAVALTGPVAFEYPIAEGVEEGFLSKGAICCLKFYDPLKGIAPGYLSEMRDRYSNEQIFIKEGHPEAEYRYHIACNKSRNDCIEALVREGVKRKRRTVVLVERKLHLSLLSKRLKDIPHEALSGDRSSEERFAAMKAMDAGTLPLILASRVFAKGVDVKSVDFILDGTGNPGRNSAMQRYGRGARKTEGKNGLWYIDISDRESKFKDAAKSRTAALAETGAAVFTIDWKGNASPVFDLLEKKLSSTSLPPSKQNS